MATSKKQKINTTNWTYTYDVHFIKNNNISKNKLRECPCCFASTKLQYLGNFTQINGEGIIIKIYYCDICRSIFNK